MGVPGRAGLWALVVVVIALIIGGIWYLQRSEPVEQEVAEPLEPDVVMPAEEREEPDPVEDPVPEVEPEPGGEPRDPEPADIEIRIVEAPEPDLPPLAESDGPVLEQLAETVGRDALDGWLREEDLVRRIVVTVNSLDDEQLALRFWPVHHIEGRAEVVRIGDDRYEWAPDNQIRYDEPVRLLTSMDPGALADLYVRFQPLFQDTYEEIAPPDSDFDDRLIAVIDHLLDMPAARASYELERPGILYEFADPELEDQSWGRKVLLRMGPDNARAVRNWLRDLRAEIVARADTQDAE